MCTFRVYLCVLEEVEKCVPSLPAPKREAYVKQVASSAGIVALASAVARNATQMLPLLAVGEWAVVGVGNCCTQRQQRTHQQPSG